MQFPSCSDIFKIAQAHIHDPNAPELVHFLFTPLALIGESETWKQTVFLLDQQKYVVVVFLASLFESRVVRIGPASSLQQ